MAALACCGVVLRSDADPTALDIVDLEPHRSQLAQSLSNARPGDVGCKLKPRSGPGCGMSSTGHPMARRKQSLRSISYNGTLRAFNRLD